MLLTQSSLQQQHNPHAGRLSHSADQGTAEADIASAASLPEVRVVQPSGMHARWPAAQPTDCFAGCPEAQTLADTRHRVLLQSQPTAGSTSGVQQAQDAQSRQHCSGSSVVGSPTPQMQLSKGMQQLWDCVPLTPLPLPSPTASAPNSLKSDSGQVEANVPPVATLEHSPLAHGTAKDSAVPSALNVTPGINVSSTSQSDDGVYDPLSARDLNAQEHSARELRHHEETLR